jgi:hypothetical protein
MRSPFEAPGGVKSEEAARYSLKGIWVGGGPRPESSAVWPTRSSNSTATCAKVTTPKPTGCGNGCAGPGAKSPTAKRSASCGRSSAPSTPPRRLILKSPPFCGQEAQEKRKRDRTYAQNQNGLHSRVQTRGACLLGEHARFTPSRRHSFRVFENSLR